MKFSLLLQSEKEDIKGVDFLNLNSISYETYFSITMCIYNKFYSILQMIAWSF